MYIASTLSYKLLSYILNSLRFLEPYFPPNAECVKKSTLWFLTKENYKYYILITRPMKKKIKQRNEQSNFQNAVNARTWQIKKVPKIIVKQVKQIAYKLLVTMKIKK